MKSIVVIVLAVCFSGVAQAHYAPQKHDSDVTFYSYCEGNRAYNLDEKNVSILKEDCQSKNLTCYEHISNFPTYTLVFASCIDLQK